MFNRYVPFAALALVVLAGCPEDEPTVVEPTATDEPMEDPAIVGDWVSEGDDVSPLLVLFATATIDATFAADGSYTVVQTDTSDASVTYTGTYTVDESTDPATIVVTQTSPTAATASGIWAVEADGSLRYEVIQTTPDIGFMPPTVEAGFGSSSGPNLAADANIQVFQPVAN